MPRLKAVIFSLFFLFSSLFPVKIFSGDEIKRKIEAFNPITVQEVFINEHHYPFYTYFDMDTPEGHLGNVIKENFDIWTHYGYYGHARDKDLIAKAYIRLFSMGQLFSWASIMDLYTPEEEHIGKIEGCWFTFYPAKFKFYNELKELVAIAYMDNDKMGVSVVSVGNKLPIARYYRTTLEDDVVNEYNVENWTLKIFDLEKLPASFLILFGAFLADRERLERN